MTIISDTLEGFRENFRKQITPYCKDRCWQVAAGGTVVLGRAFHICSLVGGSGFVSVGLLTLFALSHLGKSYENAGGKNERVLRAIKVQYPIQPIIVGGTAALALGHPISLIGKIALTIIFCTTWVGSLFFIGRNQPPDRG